LETILKQQASAAARLAEVTRTQEIIMSSQPLRSLTIKWSFPRAPETWSQTLNSMLEEVESSVNDDEMKYMDRVLYNALSSGWNRGKVMYPWMNFVAGETPTAAPVIALVRLDPSAATLIPFGLWDHATTDLLESVDSLPRYSFNPDDVSVPRNEWSHGSCALPMLTVEPDSIRLVVEIGPQCLREALDTAGTPPAAGLPTNMAVLLFSKIETMPFGVVDSSSPPPALPWDYSASTFSRSLPESLLELTPNALQELARRYRLKYMGSANVTFGGGQENQPQYYCRATVFRGTAESH
jgi:hypothetical protein